MKYHTDNGGFATSCNDIKLFYGSSTWGTRLSQIGRTTGKLIIMTYGFKSRNPKYPIEDIEFERSYLKNIFDKRPNNIFILCNTDNLDDAQIIKRLYPQIQIKHNAKINANIAILEPQTVFFSSENLGYSQYAEFGIGFHSKEIFEKMREIFRDYWKRSTEV